MTDSLSLAMRHRSFVSPPGAAGEQEDFRHFFSHGFRGTPRPKNFAFGPPLSDKRSPLLGRGSRLILWPKILLLACCYQEGSR